ncbi:hypothetical protein DOY81_008908 [Sarcophaga bullata]|nr:hypothetical protein DOY81_008908 [Sarcophaga bullata]
MSRQISPDLKPVVKYTIQNLQQVTLNNLASTFPLDSLNGLSEINNTINESNRKDYINTIKSILKVPLPKTLTEILSKNLCMDINLDGVHGACRSVGSQIVETELQDALKITKKRYIHAQCIKNKNIKPKNLKV